MITTSLRIVIVARRYRIIRTVIPGLMTNHKNENNQMAAVNYEIK